MLNHGKYSNIFFSHLIILVDAIFLNYKSDNPIDHRINIYPEAHVNTK